MPEKKHPLDPKDGYERVQDMVYAGTKTILGPAGDLFSYIFTPPWEDRRDAWIKSIEDGLKDLQDKVEDFNIETLQKNELFVTVVSQATKAALLTHENEKLEALRNACLNAAMPISPDDDMQLMFINMLDSLTSWHLRLMLSCTDTWGWKAEKKQESGDFPSPDVVGPRPLIEALFPELAGRHDFYDHLLKDLVNHGLIAHSQRPMSLPTLVYHTLVPTQIGREFQKFMTSPIEE